VPRRDCIPRRGRSNDGTGRDHHAAGGVADEQKHVAGEGATEAALRLDGRADDDELRPMPGGDAGDVLAEASGPRPHELPSDTHAVGTRHRGGGFEPLLQAHELAVEVGVDRKLPLEDGRCHQDDSSPAIGGKPAGEIDCVRGLLQVEQRHGDAAIRDRAGPAPEAARPAAKRPGAGQLHRMSWYGTEARITCGSTSSSRFT
jgi:hypothetical protein